ncbi:hypothetical protein SEMRO_2901_G339800.1 [Seminavis robusta]|uniref:Uncharacterized protein n=1 Tax=Seminavis robusta TaxID=568900 RepID=A0A9N8F387_9STRA|nr:hypothetical protein SEMRO_2901_G339800.1 [Seminavis robusta]|eukprot:Sro2901_g339800.1 n/a (171) ;mRNA; f:8062-8574
MKLKVPPLNDFGGRCMVPYKSTSKSAGSAISSQIVKRRIQAQVDESADTSQTNPSQKSRRYWGRCATKQRKINALPTIEDASDKGLRSLSVAIPQPRRGAEDKKKARVPRTYVNGGQSGTIPLNLPKSSHQVLSVIDDFEIFDSIVGGQNDDVILVDRRFVCDLWGGGKE